MKNLNEGEHQNVILSNNKVGNHNVFIMFAPTINIIIGFVLLMLLAGMVAFFITNRAGSLSFMANVFIWTIYVIAACTVVLLLVLIIKYVVGGFIRHVVEPLKRERVLFGNENFIAHTGGINVMQREQDNARYSVQTNTTAKRLQPATSIPVPTARQLFEDGTIQQATKRGNIILGYHDDGNIKILPYDLLYSADLGGVGGSGKTTTAFWIALQEIMAGTKLIIVDPHLHIRRNGIALGLGRLLEPFTKSHLFEPCGNDPKQIIERVRWMRDENRRRQQPQINLQDEPQILMVIDEFNSIVTIGEIQKELTNSIATIQREGRKVGLFYLLIAHKWAKQDVLDIRLRTNAATVMAHYYNDIGQADMLLGKDGRLCQQLKAGSYVLRGLMTGELSKVHTPNITEQDIPFLLDVLGYTPNKVVEADNKPMPIMEGLAPNPNRKFV